VTEQYPPELTDLVLPDPESWRDLAARLRRWHADVPGWRKRVHPLSQALRAVTWQQMAAEIVALAEQEASANGVPALASNLQTCARNP
jgi:hypothetical protein